MIRERIQRLLQEISRGIYEKDTELAMSLLAAIAGESLILLGPPGVAKSMVARRVKAAFRQAKSFEYLMSRFSTPDEIFGPVSISKLKDSDKYERSIEGYLQQVTNSLRKERGWKHFGTGSSSEWNVRTSNKRRISMPC